MAVSRVLGPCLLATLLLALPASTMAAWPTSAIVPAWEQTDKVADDMGASLALDGDTLVVGNAFDRCARYPGVSVFEHVDNGWIETSLQPRDDNEDGTCRGFGVDVAVDEESGIAVVGDPGFDEPGHRDAGAAYAYERTEVGEWELAIRLQPGVPDGGSHGSGVGQQVVVDGTTLALSAPHANESRGLVQVYERIDGKWEMDEELTVDEPPGSHFGTALGLDDGWLAVGASDDDSVVLFQRIDGEWTHKQSLSPPDEDPSYVECFGFSLALEEDRLAVGSPCWETETESKYSLEWSGRATLFARGGNSWGPVAEFSASDRTPGEDFGKSVALSDGVLVAGAPHAPIFYTHEGAAYVFEERGSGWAQVAELRGNDTSRTDEFGYSVAVGGGRVAVVAPFDDNRQDGLPGPLADRGGIPVYGSSGFNAGSTYVFEPSEDPMIAFHLGDIDREERPGRVPPGLT